MALTTKITTPQVTRESSPVRKRRPIELQTENGFAIIRRGDLDPNFTNNGTEHCFVVRDPDGYTLDITVDFSGAFISEVIHRTFGRITRESSFWLNCAEHHLSDYLWENSDYPPDGKLTVEYLTPNDLDLALRWETDVPTPERVLSRFIPRRTAADGDGARSKTQPIKFLTENGYTIVRLCEIDASISDSPKACKFRVTNPQGSEREMTIRFDETLIEEIQSRRRRRELLDGSKYWAVVAEKYLGDYLWRQNQFPPHDELTIDQLAGDDLLLGAHWHEQDGRQL